MFKSYPLTATVVLILGAACSGNSSSGKQADTGGAANSDSGGAANSDTGGTADADSGGAANSGGGSAGIPLADLPAKLAAAMCTAYTNCLGPVFTLFLAGEDCQTLMEQRIKNGTFPLYQSEIAAGKINYDPSKAQACIDGLTSLSCANILNRDRPECLAALDGTVDLGQSCTLNEECKGNAICQSSSGTCPGQCVPLLTAGQACTVDDDCASGLTCSTETKLCVQPSTVDQPCEYGAPPCSPGLACWGKSDTDKTSGTCKSIGSMFVADGNAACDFTLGTLCKLGQSCVADSLTANNTVNWKCLATGTFLAGATCKPAMPEACESGYYCKTSSGSIMGTCVILPATHEPCAHVFGAQCRPGAACIDSVCQNYAANGESCTSDAMCYSENCTPSGACAPRLPCQ